MDLDGWCVRRGDWMQVTAVVLKIGGRRLFNRMSSPAFVTARFSDVYS